MKTILIFALLALPVAAQETIGTGTKIGAGTTVGVPFNAAPATGLVFTPAAGTYPSAQNVTISYTPRTNNDIFYTIDGPVYSASTLFTGPIALPNPSAHTIYASVWNVGAGGGVTQNQNTLSYCLLGTSGCTASKTNWETVVGSNCALTFNLPYMKHGGGTSGCPSGGSFVQNMSSPSLDGSTLHMIMNTTTTGNTQVLYTGSQNSPAPSATNIMQDFWILQGNSGSYKSFEDELDMELFDRGLQLDLSLQCDSQASHWRWDGQGGGWREFPVTIKRDCPLPFGTLTTAITSTTQCAFTLSAPVDVGTILSFYGTENILINSVSGGGQSGTQVTGCTRGYALPGHAAGAKTTYTAGANWAEWVHVQWFGVFNPGETNCTSLNNGKPIECVYGGFLIINGVLYGSTLYGGTAWGTLNVRNSAGAAIIVPSLVAPAEPGYAQSLSRCFNQFQLYSQHVGAVDFYVDLDNVTCGYGLGPVVTGNAAYTIP